jgi:hypothetical protein
MVPVWMMCGLVMILLEVVRLAGASLLASAFSWRVREVAGGAATPHGCTWTPVKLRM